MRNHLILIFILLFSLPAFSQDDEPKSDSSKVDVFFDHLMYRLLKEKQDTTYIKNYTQEISLRAVSIWKGNFFRVFDTNQGTSIQYRPDNRVNLGVGVTYRWFSIDLAFNVGLNPGQRDDFKSEQSFDVVLSAFTNQHFIELGYKYYRGYFINSTRGLTTQLSDNDIFRSDLRMDLFTLEYLYALNYKKFSFKAPFVNNEVQLKSAGSPIFGANFISTGINGNTSVLPDAVEGSFNKKLDFSGLKVFLVTFNAGYMYSFVVKKSFYFTLGIIPGLSLNAGDRTIDIEIESISPRVSWRVKGMSAIGYSKRKFYIGLSSSNNLFFIPMEKNAPLEIRNGKVKFFVGYRLRGKRLDDN